LKSTGRAEHAVDLGIRQSGIFFAAGLDWPIPLEAACEFRFLEQRDFRAWQRERLTEVASLHPIMPDGQITISPSFRGSPSGLNPESRDSGPHIFARPVYLAVIHFVGLLYHNVIQAFA
jgi:hypothetical protein